MTAMQEMYAILEEMVAGAKSDNLESVTEFNKRFEVLVPHVYHKPVTELDLMYDNCRQSCVMAERMRTMHQEFLSNAIERFSKIPKPE
jgi:hypothetical protein